MGGPRENLGRWRLPARPRDGGGGAEIRRRRPRGFSLCHQRPQRTESCGRDGADRAGQLTAMARWPNALMRTKDAIAFAVIVLGALLQPVVAMEGSETGFPEYDSAAACARSMPISSGTAQYIKPDESGLTERICIRDENEARDAARYLWADLPSDVQTHCRIVVKLSAPATVQYQSLHNCLEEMDSAQHQFAGEIPISVRKK